MTGALVPEAVKSEAKTTPPLKTSDVTDILESVLAEVTDEIL